MIVLTAILVIKGFKIYPQRNLVTRLLGRFVMILPVPLWRSAASIFLISSGFIAPGITVTNEKKHRVCKDKVYRMILKYMKDECFSFGFICYRTAVFVLQYKK